jgi:hypothetical protein
VPTLQREKIFRGIVLVATQAPFGVFRIRRVADHVKHICINLKWKIWLLEIVLVYQKNLLTQQRSLQLLDQFLCFFVVFLLMKPSGKVGM